MVFGGCVHENKLKESYH